MHIYSISLYEKNICTCRSSNLKSIGYFKRYYADQFMNFFSQTIADRYNEQNKMQCFEEEEYMCYVYKINDKTCVIISDTEYPSQIISTICQTLLTKYINQDYLDKFIEHSDNPKNINKIYGIQCELDETKKIMHKNIDTLLERGEKLDDLIEKTNQLSISSKQFYKQAKKMNTCCTIA